LLLRELGPTLLNCLLEVCVLDICVLILQKFTLLFPVTFGGVAQIHFGLFDILDPPNILGSRLPPTSLIVLHFILKPTEEVSQLALQALQLG
jgi:hypothetical protein